MCGIPAGGLAYTRYWFVSGLVYTNQYYSMRTHPVFRHPPPPSVHTIWQYNVSPRPLIIAIYTTHHWQLQYRVKANRRTSRGMWCLRHAGALV